MLFFIREILLQRYVILEKLGWGHFSTVWLTKDLHHDSYVALKIQKSAQHYLEAAFDEVEILEQTSSKWETEKWQKSAIKYSKIVILCSKCNNKLRMELKLTMQHEIHVIVCNF
jgi:serine/threonine protein kinase